MAMLLLQKCKLTSSSSLVRIACLSSTTTPPGGAKPPKAPPAAPAKPPSSPKAPPSSASSSSEPAVDSTKYNVPDYFGHNTFSYYDIDAAVHKLRIPQPNKFNPLVPKK